MARVVESVVAEYKEGIHWEKVVTKEMAGAMRFGELTKKLGRPAPVPSIFINGELVFDVTPGPDEFKEHLDHLIADPK